MITVKCQYEKCGQRFQAQRSTAKFCCPSHRTLANRKTVQVNDKKNAKRQKFAHCKYCGKRFQVNPRGRIPSFCRDSHRVLHHNALTWAVVRAYSKAVLPGHQQPICDAYTAWSFVENEGTASMEKTLNDAYNVFYDGRDFSPKATNMEMF
jgi:hypothetical protein